MSQSTAAKDNANRNRINSCQSQIAGLRSENASLQKRLDNLRHGKTLVARKESTFHDDMASQARTLTRVGQIPNMKIASAYHKDMSGLLNGNRYRSARQGFECMKRDIQRAIQRLEEEIMSNNRSISRLQSEIDSLNRQM